MSYYTPTLDELFEGGVSKSADAEFRKYARIAFDRRIASVERAAAEKALTDAADRVTEWGNDHSVWWDDENEVYDEPSNWLRARAEAYRGEKNE